MTPEDKAQERIKVLAGNVRNDRHLRRIIMRAQPAMRHEVYDLIAPHLNFKPKPFFTLNPWRK